MTKDSTSESTSGYLVPIVGTLAVILFSLYWFVFKKNSKKPKVTSVEEHQKKKTAKNQKKKEGTMTMKEAKKLIRQKNNKKKRTRPDHPLFFLTLGNVQGKKIDFDLSADNHYMIVACQERRHFILDSKRVYTKQKVKSIHFETLNIPTLCAISEHGRYVSLAFEKKSIVYKIKANEVIEVFRTDEKINPSKIIGMYISCVLGLYITCGGGRNPDITVFDLERNILEVIKTHLTEPFGVIVDKTNQRIIIESKTTSMRIYRLKHDNLNRYKKIDKEFVCTGNKTNIISGSFSSDGKRIVSLSQGGKLKLWDLTGMAFCDAPVEVLNQIKLDTKYRIVEWCYPLKNQEADGVIALVGEDSLDFYKIGTNVFEKIESVEDPHIGNRLEKMRAVHWEGHHGLYSRCWARLYAWKLDEIKS